MVNFILMPSLEQRALIKTTLMLLNEEFWSEISEFRIIPGALWPKNKMLQWKNAERKVIQNVSKLCIPEFLKKKLSIAVEAICLEVLKWRQYHDISYVDFYQINKLCWKPEGTVDKKKTAELLIKNDNYRPGQSLSIIKRYRLACIYCLEDDILELWKKMTDEQKASFLSPRNTDEHDLVLFWTYWKNEVSTAMVNIITDRMKVMLGIIQHEWTTFQCVFEYSVMIGNKVAAEYFLQKLSFAEREESLMRSVGYASYKREVNRERICSAPSDITRTPKQNFTEILCFILSQMDEEKQKEVLKSFPCLILSCLLDWPWQEIFIETANHVWEYLDKQKLEICLKKIIDKYNEGYSHGQSIFEEFWKSCPESHKKSVTEDPAGGRILFFLFMSENEKNIKLFLNSISIAERKKFIFCDMGKAVFRDLIQYDKWDLLEFFIQECMLSDDEMKKLEQEYKDELNVKTNCSVSRFEIDKQMKFFKLLEYFICGDGKRKREQTDNSVASKRRNLVNEEAA